MTKKQQFPPDFTAESARRELESRTQPPFFARSGQERRLTQGIAFTLSRFDRTDANRY
jgi:hypothetical protein